MKRAISFVASCRPFLIWPDPGLSRNTRCRCYRCSVPGLAGFTRLALCGARDLISRAIFNCRMPIANCSIKLSVPRTSVCANSKIASTRERELKPRYLEIGNWQSTIANVYMAVLRCANIRSNPLIPKCNKTYATIAMTMGSSNVWPPSVRGLATMPLNGS